jgi:ferrochelatase
MAKRGVLLINVGTPQAPAEAEVRSYLREFLMDPYVIDIPFPLRWSLVHGLILPRRPARSAEAYRKVWTERGSPLLSHMRDMTEGLQAALGSGWVVRLGMRYGEPSILGALRELAAARVTDLLVVPAFPQYALAATETAIRETQRRASETLDGAPVAYLPAFYDSSHFIGPFAKIGADALHGFEADHVLYSFHGLPERQIRRTDRSPRGQAHCLAGESCCERISDANRDCYRAQCFATARALAERMAIPREKWSVSFQSRLGQSQWIRPFTDVRLEELARSGVRRLAVMCPAFVADCLETLEEIGIRARQDFISFGGTELKLIPSLNASEVWIAGLRELVLGAARAGKGEGPP